MALIAIDLNETIEYISSIDRKDEKPTVFCIGVLTNHDKLKLMPIFKKEGGNTEALMNAFALGVKKVINVKKKDGTAIAEMSSSEASQLLPISAIIEVAQKVVEFNFISEIEEKN